MLTTVIWAGIGRVGIGVSLALAFAVAAMAGARADDAAPKVHVVAYALDSDQDVFAKEATKAARIVHRKLGRGGEVIVRANTRRKRSAMIADLRRDLNGLAAKMDRGKDVLFLFVTSHGTRSGAMVKAGATSEVLSPADLAEMLAGAGIRHSIVVISACYSGVFADALAGPATLVITASDPHRPSFGCRNGANWTYFGRAFFAEALAQTTTLKAAFAFATMRIAKREKANRFEHSNPMMAGGERVLARLGQARDPTAGAQDTAAAAPQPQRSCMLKPEPLARHESCRVFHGYADGKRVGYFRLSGGRKAPRVGVAAGGACPQDFVRGELVSSNKIRARGLVYTLAPDCRSSVKTTQ